MTWIDYRYIVFIGIFEDVRVLRLGIGDCHHLVYL